MVPPSSPQWALKIKIDQTEYSGIAESTICFPVLQSAVLTQDRWHILLETDDDSHKIMRVRVIDNRVDICKGDLGDQMPDQAYLPLQPTFFGNETPPKWGFFFAVEKNCKEYKGTSIDVYAVVEYAWRNKKTVVLTLDGYLIVGARPA